MNRSEILRKLSSRKFWAAVIAWATSLLAAFNVDAGTTAKIILIVSGIGSLAVYMLAESIVDAKNKPETSLAENSKAELSDKSAESDDD